MKFFALITLLFCLATPSIQNDAISGLAENVEFLKSKVQQLENKDSELEKMKLQLEKLNLEVIGLREENVGLRDKISSIQSEQSAAIEVFDCYVSDTWAEDGTIIYDGCSVDTTAGNPSSGLFQVGQGGIYRLTFMGCVFIPPDPESNPYGYAMLLVDGGEVARAFLNPIISDTAGYYMVSIDTLQQLEPGQQAGIVWVGIDGANLYSYTDSVHIRFTGQLLGSATVQ